MERGAGSGSANHDEWGSAVASGDVTKLAELVLVWSGSKPEPALLFLRNCVYLLEEKVTGSAPASSPLPSPPTLRDEWGAAVASDDAAKLAELVLLWSGSKHEPALGLLRNCVSLMEEEVAFSAPASAPLQSPPRMPGPTGTSCLNAFIVALNETCNGKGWFTSTKELQLVSLDLCITCRTYQTLHLKVYDSTPRRLLAAADAPPRYPKRLCGTRVPRLRARRVTWEMRTAAELRNPIFAMTDVDYLEFGVSFKGSLDPVAWPRRLKTIKFWELSRFNQPIHMVEWPASLQQLFFGERFNQPVEHVQFPASLKQLILRGRFNQPIAGSVLPASLLELHLEGDFNQPIEGVAWPDSIQNLVFGHDFNQSIANVRWPASLQEISFGWRLDPLDTSFIECAAFNQSVGSSVWPASLRRLTLGGDFRQSLQRLGTWMPNLEALRLFDWSLSSHNEHPLRDVEWPKALRELTVFGGWSLGEVEIPSTIYVLHHEEDGAHYHHEYYGEDYEVYEDNEIVESMMRVA